jgi:hypothetical protein
MNRGILKDRKGTIFCDKETQSLQGTKIVLRQVAGIISPSNVQVNKKDRKVNLSFHSIYPIDPTKKRIEL